MNPSLIAAIISTVGLLAGTSLAAWLGFRGSKRASQAQEKVGMVDAAIDGLNQTVMTLRSELTIARTEVEHLRNKCNVLIRNDQKMQGYIRQRSSHEEFDALDLEVVPNGF